MTTVLSTYRLQLRPGFGLREAESLVPYLSRLGVSHVYLSPILRARSGSPHGYDVVDPTEINPELGDHAALEALVAELRRHRMGAILDIVPNHMATGGENPFWEDVLRHGPSSRFAPWFDIDWGPPTSRRPYRILLPVLGERLGRVIDAAELKLEYRQGRFRLNYHDQTFPLDPGTIPLVLEVGMDELLRRLGPAEQQQARELQRIIARLRALPPRTTRRAGVGSEREAVAQEALARLARLIASSPPVRHHMAAAVAAHRGGSGDVRLLRRLVAAQVYRLAYWRRAAREINYRRFFTISHLVALRQEDPEVFEGTHRLVLDWVAARLVDGLRIDHVDGMLDPSGYLRRLRDEVQARVPGPDGERFPVYVEKILARDERLPEDWLVAGTTGYDFLAEVEDVFLEPKGFQTVERGYQRFVHRTDHFEDAARRGRRGVLDGALLAEARRLGRLLESAVLGYAGDLTRSQLTEAVVESIVCLGVYRTYLPPAAVEHRPADRRRLSGALEAARQRGRASPLALDLLRDALLLSPELPLDREAIARRSRFVQRYQQTCVSVAAKGVEDTALYVHVALVSRNEVGAEPDAPLTDPLSVLHTAASHRRKRWPIAMLATSTHDTKRSADVRARLDVLSETPALWERKVREWHRWNQRHRKRVGRGFVPNRNVEYLLYETLVGMWPWRDHGPDGTRPAEAGPARPRRGPSVEFTRRVHEYMLKAAREAKTHTSWTEPNESFEDALEEFVAAVLSPRKSDRFLSDLDAFVEMLARAGLWNSLARTIIHLTAPGTPDLYQGDELWNYSLVDPDNRRAVDFKGLGEILDTLTDEASTPDRNTIAELVKSPGDGRLKLLIVHRALHLRAMSPGLFRDGEYLPLRARGARAAHVVAYARHLDEEAAIVLAPRLSLALTGSVHPAPVGAEVWRDTRVELPARLAASAWRCALSGTINVPPHRSSVSLSIAAALQTLPVAVLQPMR